MLQITGDSCIIRLLWRRGRVVRQRSAKPRTPVQIRSVPPITFLMNTTRHPYLRNDGREMIPGGYLDFSQDRRFSRFNTTDKDLLLPGFLVSWRSALVWKTPQELKEKAVYIQAVYTGQEQASLTPATTSDREADLTSQELPVFEVVVDSWHHRGIKLGKACIAALYPGEAPIIHTLRPAGFRPVLDRELEPVVSAGPQLGAVDGATLYYSMGASQAVSA